MNSIVEYFSGEKLQCTVGIVLSTVSILIALYFLLQLKTAFFKGMAWPFIVISLLLLTVCIGVVLRTPSDIQRVTSFVEQDQKQIQLKEIPRMEKVLKNFKVIKTVEVVLFFLGLGLFFFGHLKDASLLKGIGLGIAIQTALMLGFDFFAHERGKAYFDLLQHFSITKPH